MRASCLKMHLVRSHLYFSVTNCELIHDNTSENSFKKFGSERPFNQPFQSEFFKSSGTKADDS